ncbi:WG repeat-containing protein [Tissierella sp.]|uniref:WG repeat-containing protein n=1 Tax=Tissierella sp. TaxID=41274 RepID=UPI0028604482|nr:WG repeat-containing protein [Tissierella sp.]MDR7857459.1 WG repeat-containing protein [Tissierella sp.]
MKSISKKVLTFILSLMLIFTMIPREVYANEFSYSKIIDPIYDYARNFSEGLAAVMKDGKWGYIDKTGKTVLEFKYDIAYSFSENKALVGMIGTKDDGYDEYSAISWGLIDKEGKSTPLLYDDGSQFSTIYYEEYFSFEQTSQYLYNGALTMRAVGWDATFGTDGKMMFANTQLGQIHQPTEGVVAVYAEGTDFIGYIDQKTGEILFEDKNFADVRPFNQGMAFVCFYDQNLGQYHWKIMDINGNFLSDTIYSNFYVKNLYSEYKIFNDNTLASVQDSNGKWGAIDISGKTVLPFIYDNLRVFDEGVAAFSRDGKFGFIDINGNEVIAPQFDDVSLFNNGIAVARVGDSAFCIDKYGKKIVGAEKLPVDTYFVESGFYDDGSIRYIVYSPGRYVIFEENGKYGLGEIKFTPSLPTANEMDSWALEEVTLAIKNNLVPNNLQNMYRADITRVDFAALVVKAIEEVAEKDINEILKEKTGKTLYELVSKYPFEDTTNTNVIAAQALGIINGKSEGKFAPYDTITRQEAAALLMRTAKYFGQESVSEGKGFNDSKDIANYAKEAVDYVAGLEIMTGKSGNVFAPTDSYNREQAYMTIYRLFNVLVNK